MVIDIIAKILCLVVFSIVKLPLSSVRSHSRELSFFGFPLLRKSKGYTLDSGLTPARGDKKNTEIPPTAPIPPRNRWTGLSAPF